MQRGRFVGQMRGNGTPKNEEYIYISADDDKFMGVQPTTRTALVVAFFVSKPRRHCVVLRTKPSPVLQWMASLPRGVLGCN